MSYTLPKPINNGNYAFLTGQYFTVYPVDINFNDFIGRITFCELTGIEFTRDVTEYWESGSSEPHIRGDKRKYNNITLRRGFAYTPSTQATLDSLENWYESGTKINIMIDIFNDQEGTGDDRNPLKAYRVTGATPVRFKPWEGKADAGEIQIQELELACERYKSVPVQAAAAVV